MRNDHRTETLPSLSEQVLQVLKEAIVSLQLEPGAPISETYLTEWLRASRTPIRQALKQLESEGLALSLPQRGTFVTKLRQKELRDAAVMRRLLENWALLEMQRIGESPDLDRLNALLEHQQAAVEERSYYRFLHWDTEFHKEILRAAHNGKLLELYEHVNVTILRVRAWMIQSLPQALGTSLAEHRTMFQVIRERQWDQLSQLMLGSADEFLLGVTNMAAAHPEYFEETPT